MASPIPSMGALRVLRQSIQPQVQQTTQVRHATLLRRPKRPYTFTQLITLSDGSSFTLRTTNPQPVYKSAKDIRNSPLWNPSSQKLLNVEEDEAGRLASFRTKFGRAWDADTDADKGNQTEGHLLDLISSQGKPQGKPTDATKSPPAKAPESTPAKPAAKK
ncbi:mitochondrial 54S ribosomal protein bL31m [Alternaria dauci]|uniref:Ribosomal protein bL31m N-terminal domain-containing protein n=1 Tax=Alternaria dauci TaxID=48095 RepID=A0ABR3UVM6_9PLEO